MAYAEGLDSVVVKPQRDDSVDSYLDRIYDRMQHIDLILERCLPQTPTEANKVTGIGAMRETVSQRLNILHGLVHKIDEEVILLEELLGNRL